MRNITRREALGAGLAAMLFGAGCNEELARQLSLIGTESVIRRGIEGPRGTTVVVNNGQSEEGKYVSNKLTEKDITLEIVNLDTGEQLKFNGPEYIQYYRAMVQGGIFPKNGFLVTSSLQGKIQNCDKLVAEDLGDKYHLYYQKLGWDQDWIKKR